MNTVVCPDAGNFVKPTSLGRNRLEDKTTKEVTEESILVFISVKKLELPKEFLLHLKADKWIAEELEAIPNAGVWQETPKG